MSEIITLLKKLDFELICKKLDTFGRFNPEDEAKIDPYKVEDETVSLLKIQELLLDDADKTCTFGNHHPFGDRFLKCHACGKFHLNRNTSKEFFLFSDGFVMGWASTLEEAKKLCQEKNWFLDKEESESNNTNAQEEVEN